MANRLLGSPLLFLIVIILLMICELKGQTCTPKKQPQPCTAPWVMTSNPRTCLFHVEVSRPTKEARQMCSSQNATVAIARDPIQAYNLITFLNRFAPNPVRFFWLGLSNSRGDGKWRWLEEDAEASWANWEIPRYFLAQTPTSGQKCALLDVSDNTWREADCDTRYHYLCAASSAGRCTGDFHVVGPHTLCLKESKAPSGFYKAKENCGRLGAKMITIRNFNDSNMISEFFRSKERVLLGLNDALSEDSFMWFLGDVTSYTNWAPNEPEGDESENCVYMDSAGLWYETSCEDSMRFVCQKPSIAGPEAPKMTVRYHLADDTVFFLGRQLVANCTAFGTEHGRISWVVANYEQISMDLPATISNRIETTTTKDGACRERTVSTLTMETTEHLDGGYLSCYTYDIPTKKICSYLDSSRALCALSEVIMTIEGPTGPTTLTLTFHKDNFTLVEGRLLEAECQIYPDTKGTLVWVLYSDSNAQVLPADHEWITSKEYAVDSASRPVIRSRVQKRVTRHLTNSSIACFSYDAKKLTRKLRCLDNDIYCEKSPNFLILETDEEPHGWYFFPRMGFFGILFYVLLIASCLAVPIKFYGQYDEGEGRMGKIEPVPDVAGAEEDENLPDTELEDEIVEPPPPQRSRSLKGYGEYLWQTIPSFRTLPKLADLPGRIRDLPGRVSGQKKSFPAAEDV